MKNWLNNKNDNNNDINQQQQLNNNNTANLRFIHNDINYYLIMEQIITN